MALHHHLLRFMLKILSPIPTVRVVVGHPNTMEVTQVAEDEVLVTLHTVNFVVKMDIMKTLVLLNTVTPWKHHLHMRIWHKHFKLNVMWLHPLRIGMLIHEQLLIWLLLKTLSRLVHHIWVIPKLLLETIFLFLFLILVLLPFQTILNRMMPWLFHISLRIFCP